MLYLNKCFDFIGELEPDDHFLDDDEDLSDYEYFGNGEEYENEKLDNIEAEQLKDILNYYRALLSDTLLFLSRFPSIRLCNTISGWVLAAVSKIF